MSLNLFGAYCFWFMVLFGGAALLGGAVKLYGILRGDRIYSKRRDKMEYSEAKIVNGQIVKEGINWIVDKNETWPKFQAWNGLTWEEGAIFGTGDTIMEAVNDAIAKMPIKVGFKTVGNLGSNCTRIIPFIKPI